MQGSISSCQPRLRVDQWGKRTAHNMCVTLSCLPVVSQHFERTANEAAMNFLKDGCKGSLGRVLVCHALPKINRQNIPHGSFSVNTFYARVSHAI